MTHAAKLARETALTDALRAVDEAIGLETPTDQAFRIIEAIKRLRATAPVTVPGTDRVDYLARVQELAHAAWTKAHGGQHGNVAAFGPQADATASIATPLGRLRLTAWRAKWNGGKRPERAAWAGEYYLDDQPITIAEIKAAGLARRPTSRNRQKSALR